MSEDRQHPSEHIEPGQHAALTVRALNAAGGAVPGAAVAWSSSDATVARVSRDTLTAVGAGTATLTAASGGKTASVTVAVVPKPKPVPLGPGPVASLDVTPPRLQLTVSRTSDLHVTARDARGILINRTPVEWVSSNPPVAAVTARGVVTGVSPGSAKITAKRGGVTSGAAEVTVIAAGPAPPAVLKVQLVTAWAFVSVDGLARGQKTLWVEPLPPGVPHRLHFERDGFVTIDTSVTLQPGEERVLRIVMTPK